MLGATKRTISIATQLQLFWLVNWIGFFTRPLKIKSYVPLINQRILWDGMFCHAHGLRFNLLEAFVASFLFGNWFREAASDSELVIFVRESLDWKVIDSEGLDDQFFVALTKDFFVDHPGRCACTSSTG